jgi:SAM-dependent methyltransferase
MKIENLPFFTGACVDKENFGFPLFYKFDLFIDENLNMYRQRSSPELDILLLNVYKQGSLADGSISSESGKDYIEKTLEYLVSHFNFVESARILEIGVGMGVIISELSNWFPSCKFVGIEPGNFELAIDTQKIELIRDFFPSMQVQGQFDLVYSLLVLEHIESPEKFINNISAILAENGKIIMAVPNCEPYIQNGDISMFVHEHFSYFTIESVHSLAKKTGFSIEDISVINGALYFVLSRNKIQFSKAYSIIDYSSYFKKFQEFSSLFLDLTRHYKQNEIVIYSPIRALNLLHLIGKYDIRLVDDSSQLWGKHLPGLSSPIESIDQVCDNPPKIIIIYSRTFGERIKLKCLSLKMLEYTKIICLEEIC